jgi:hypothetical protein
LALTQLSGNQVVSPDNYVLYSDYQSVREEGFRAFISSGEKKKKHWKSHSKPLPLSGF